MTPGRAFTFETPSGRKLFGTVSGAAEPGPRPTVVVCHGFKGFQEWGFFPSVARLLSERGITAVRFNFHGAGMRPGDELVTDLEAFRRATFSGDVEDLLAVVAALGDEIAPGAVDRERLGLFGHSRGGGIALLAAADERLRARLRALVTWSAVATFDRTSDEEKRAWRAAGAFEVVNARTGQRLPLGTELLDDFEANRERLDLGAAARRRAAPWLVVHGALDETVPATEGERLAAEAAPERELLVVPAGDHTFGARHPFAGPTPELITALNATQAWFRRHL